MKKKIGIEIWWWDEGHFTGTRIFHFNWRDEEKLEEIDFIKEYTNQFSTEVKEQAEINIKYKGYIDKERDNVAKLTRLETIKIADDFDYNNLKSLSTEAKQKFIKIRPKTIAQAARISGVSPADINILLIYLK